MEAGRYRENMPRPPDVERSSEGSRFSDGRKSHSLLIMSEKRRRVINILKSYLYEDVFVCLFARL